MRSLLVRLCRLQFFRIESVHWALWTVRPRCSTPLNPLTHAIIHSVQRVVRHDSLVAAVTDIEPVGRAAEKQTGRLVQRHAVNCPILSCESNEIAAVFEIRGDVEDVNDVVG